MATLTLRRLWVIDKRTALRSGLSERHGISTPFAFYGVARGVLKVLAHLIEHGECDELHATIKRQGRQIETLQSRRRRARPH
jgi:hypothetical protein